MAKARVNGEQWRLVDVKDTITNVIHYRLHDAVKWGEELPSDDWRHPSFVNLCKEAVDHPKLPSEYLARLRGIIVKEGRRRVEVIRNSSTLQEAQSNAGEAVECLRRGKEDGLAACSEYVPLIFFIGFAF